MSASHIDGRRLRMDWSSAGDRPAMLRRQISLSQREAEQFALVGAARAARYWSRRAARLRYRLSKLS